MLNFEKIKTFTDKEYADFCKFIYDYSGIHLTEKKRSLVNNRLRKRVLKHNFSSYGEYFNYVKKHRDEEFVMMINVITTNVSSFFRDEKQFKYLSEEVIKNLGKNRLKIWSAGCSTGEEPYSIALSLTTSNPEISFDILATDLSTRVLDFAKVGIYKEEQLKTVPDFMLRKYFRKVETGQYQIKPEIKKNIRFDKLNLIKDTFPNNIDIIFCRNVIIYFDKETKDKLFVKYAQSLNKGGYLFLGHSESLFNNPLFKFYKPSIYIKKIKEEENSK
ncbi:MAG: CheR family methyltransferase [Spirochaetota bacterium]